MGAERFGRSIKLQKVDDGAATEITTEELNQSKSKARRHIPQYKTTNQRMDQKQLPKDSKPADILDLPPVPSAADSRVDFSENQKQKYQGAAMCEDEWRIRGELETEIERDLEQEIKDGIYHLAFKLHRLYQHKRERNAEDISESGGKQNDKTLSEVNISIKMEGGTRIEIKETKKDQPLRPRTRSSRSKDVKGMLGSKRFDWANSLRAGADPAILNRRSERSYQAKVSSNDPQLENTRRNLAATGSVLRKGNMGVNNKLLELGWKW
ncbi:hypothetical protein V6N12_021190 [Hibiscus sabdariffa]|uniref:Uncharacterized protein n=1 Tax=Hibiscus sabdariffa TaxID=183260 RepID=A0ABR2FR21_9ROSI